MVELHRDVGVALRRGRSQAARVGRHGDQDILLAVRRNLGPLPAHRLSVDVVIGRELLRLRAGRELVGVTADAHNRRASVVGGLLLAAPVALVPSRCRPRAVASAGDA